MYEIEQRRLLKDIPKELIKAMCQANAFILGGAITSIFCNRKINDYDLYFKSLDDCNEFLSLIGLTPILWTNVIKWSFVLKKEKIFNFDFKSYIGKKILSFHIIKIPELINLNIMNTLKKFDFTVCCGAYDMKENKFILMDNFIEHNKQKKLIINSITNISDLKARIEKYEDKGYDIPLTELIKYKLFISSLSKDSNYFVNLFYPNNHINKNFLLNYIQAKIDKKRKEKHDYSSKIISKIRHFVYS